MDRLLIVDDEDIEREGMLAWAATLIAMKGYALTGAKMKEIQQTNALRSAAVAEGMTLEQAMKKYPCT